MPADGLTALGELGALPPGRHRLARNVASMADGTTISLPVNVLMGDRPGPRLVAIAGVHGDEHDGPAALLEISDRIEPEVLRGMLVVVPVANPPAFRVARRWNPDDGANLNRILPADPAGSITHRLGAVLIEEVVTGADFVLTIHGWTAGSLTVPYVEYTAGHSTSRAAREGAAAFGLPYLEPLGLLPGRLMSLVAESGIAGCEVEIGGEGITLPDRAAIGVRGVERLLRHLAMIDDAALTATPGQRDIARAQLVAPVGGALRQTSVRVGDTVRVDEPLATIVDLNGRALEDLRSPANGVLAMRRHALCVEPGDLVAVVFTDPEPGRISS